MHTHSYFVSGILIKTVRARNKSDIGQIEARNESDIGQIEKIFDFVLCDIYSTKFQVTM